jgi:metal-dependent amidase/aminoacylase/carboxypeptidase family protein
MRALLVPLVLAACAPHPAPATVNLATAPARLDEAGLIALRRAIHRHPELAGHEVKTAALVAERLRALGLEVRTHVGGNGVIAFVRGALPGPLIAYRSDLDAVDDDERAAVPFKSEVAGAAHLCGHDIHIAVAVGVAEILVAARARLHGTVELLFQPAEEDMSGARALIAAGALEPLPREIYAVHAFPLPVGTIGYAPGVGLAGLDRFDIELPSPEAAAELAPKIETLATVRRPSDGEGWQRIMTALTAQPTPLADFVWVRANADAATVHVAVRAAHDGDYSRTRLRVAMLAAGAGEPHPVGERLPGMFSDARLSEAALPVLAGVVGREHLVRFTATVPFNGEDFAYYQQKVRGAMFWLGVANPAAGINGLPHAPDFQADEAAIAVGARAMAALLAARLAAP